MFNFKWTPVSDGIKWGRLGHVDPHKREKGTMGQKPALENKRSDPGASKLVKENSKDHPPAPAQDKISQQMVNHIEHHQLLTEKYNLLMVMQRFCDLHKESAFDLMPITFFVEISDASRDHLVTQALTPFVTFWQALEANRSNLFKLKETLIRQLHQKNDLLDKEAIEVDNGAEK